MKLKLLTLNLHCLEEEGLETKQRLIVDTILSKDIDIVFLQEVAGSISETNMSEDNYGFVLQRLLEEEGEHYDFHFQAIKKSFSKYDEGIGILSKHPLLFSISKTISKSQSYDNWKTRKILAYRLKDEQENILVATTHFGWSDGYEVFEEQFDLATKDFSDTDLIIVAGDFNISPGSKEYRHIIEKGWLDIFESSDISNEPTFIGDTVNHMKLSRIDHMVTNRPVRLLNAEILFKDIVVSDHYGLYAEIDTIK